MRKPRSEACELPRQGGGRVMTFADGGEHFEFHRGLQGGGALVRVERVEDEVYGRSGHRGPW
jgi:hypothetical protein